SLETQAVADNGAGRSTKRRRVSAGGSSVDGSGAKDSGGSELESMDRPERTQRQTRSSSNAQPTSRKASILSRAATAPDNVSATSNSSHTLPSSPTSLALSTTPSASTSSSSSTRGSSPIPPEAVKESQAVPSIPFSSPLSSAKPHVILARHTPPATLVASSSSGPVKNVTAYSTSGGVGGAEVISGICKDLPAEAAPTHSLPEYTMTIDPAVLDRAQGQLVIVDPLSSEEISLTVGNQQQHDQQQQYLAFSSQEQKVRCPMHASASDSIEQAERVNSSPGALTISLKASPQSDLKGELPDLHINVSECGAGGDSPSNSEKPKQIRERRSTRSLEALFQVTDSELQNMREDPSNPADGMTASDEKLLNDQQKYVFLKDFNLMDLPDTAQIFITSSSTASSTDFHNQDQKKGIFPSKSVKTSGDALLVPSTTTATASISSSAVPGTSSISNSVMAAIGEAGINAGAITLGLKDLDTLTLYMPNSQDSKRQPGSDLQLLEAVKLLNPGVVPSTTIAVSTAGQSQQQNVVKQEGIEKNIKVTTSVASDPPLPDGNGKRKQPQQTTSDGKAAKVGKYKCSYCDITCAKPSVLEKHLRTHTNERPFPCVVCGVSFKTKSNLSKHWKSNSHVSRTGISCIPSVQDGSEAVGSVVEDREKEGQLVEENVSHSADKIAACVIEGVDKSSNSSQSLLFKSQDESLDDSGAAGLPGSSLEGLAQSAAKEGVKKEIVDAKLGSSQESSELVTKQSHGVLEGIRQKIDKNKRQQQEGWFNRVFKAFDKPSQSELVKYCEVHNLVRPNIICMDDIAEAGEVLGELESLKAQASNDLSKQCNGEPKLPILMTHEFISGDRMRIKVLSPRLEFAINAEARGTTLNINTKDQNEAIAKNVGFQKSEIRSSLGSSGGTVLKMLSTPSIQPGLLNKTSMSIASQFDTSHNLLSAQPIQSRPLLSSHSSDLTADRVSTTFDTLSSKRLKTFSHSGSDHSLSSLPSVFSQSSREASFDENARKILETSVSTSVDPSLSSMPSRNPLLGNSKSTAAFSTLATNSDTNKRSLVYQHALDTEQAGLPVRGQFKSGAASLTLMKDIVEHRIQKIISTNAEVVEKSPIVEMPRSKNRYLRQASDSTGFHTMRLSDLQGQVVSTSSSLGLKPGNALLAVDKNADRTAVKKKLAASLSVGDSTGKEKDGIGTSGLLRPDHLVRRSNSTSSLKALGRADEMGTKSSVLAAALTSPSPTMLLAPTTSDLSGPQKGFGLMQVDGLVHTVAVSQQGGLIVLPHSQQHQHLQHGVILAQQLQKTSSQTEAHSAKSLTQPQLAALSKAQLLCFSAADFSSKPSVSQTGHGMLSSSPSGGGIVAVQDVKLQEANLASTSPAVLAPQNMSTTPPTKIVQGPGPREIQIQIQLSQPSDGNSTGGTSSVHDQTPKSSLHLASRATTVTSEAASIIGSILQAPKQHGSVNNQSIHQLSSASNAKLESPLVSALTEATTLYEPSHMTQVNSYSPLKNSVSLGGQPHDISTSMGKNKIGSSGSLHDQKRLMSRQSSAPGIFQPSSSNVMSALQQRLSIPVNSDSQILLQQIGSLPQGVQSLSSQQSSNAALSASSQTPIAVAKPLGSSDSKDRSQLKLLTTEHFKSQGLSDGLAAAAREYILSGPIVCSDCSEKFAQVSDLHQHRAKGLCSANPTSTLRRSLSEKHVLLTDLHPESLNKTESEVQSKPLIANNSGTDFEQNTTESSSLSKSLTVAGGIETLTDGSKSGNTSSLSDASTVPITTSSGVVGATQSPSNDKNQLPSNTVADNSSQFTLRRKKGRPKGSKNRPKDLNLVIAKARGAATTGVPTGSLETEGGAGAIKQNLVSQGQAGQLVFVQGGQYPKLLLPRSSSITTKPQETVAVIAKASAPAHRAVVISSASSLPSSTGANLVAGSWLASSASSTGKVVLSFPVSGVAPLTPVTPSSSNPPSNPTQLQILSHNRSRPELTLNISTANTVSPRVIPYIPAVTFHSVESPGIQVTERKIAQAVSQVPSQLAPTPVTPLTPATPDTPTDLAGTRRRLKDKLLQKQSLSSDRGSIDSNASSSSGVRGEKKNQIPPTAITGSLSTASEAMPQYSTALLSSSAHLLNPPLPSVTKPTTSSNSALRATLTKPVVSSSKLGSLPTAVITSAVMGGKSGSEQAMERNSSRLSPTVVSEGMLRLTSEPGGDHIHHPPVLRAFSEPAIDTPIKKMRRHRSYVPSPLSIEDNKSEDGASKTMAKVMTPTTKDFMQHNQFLQATPCSPAPGKPRALSFTHSLRTDSESGSMKDSFDSGLGLHSLSQESGQLTATGSQKSFYFSKASSYTSLGSLDPGTANSDMLMIDLSGENFNNVTIPINFGQPFVSTYQLQSGPLLTEWNHPSRATGMHVTLSSITLAGSKLVLPAVNSGDNLLKERRNWLTKRSICLHRIFQVPSQLWHLSAPNTLDALTAMAFALGNPSPTRLIQSLLAQPKSSSGSTDCAGRAISPVESSKNASEKSEAGNPSDKDKLLPQGSLIKAINNDQNMDQGETAKSIQGSEKSESKTFLNKEVCPVEEEMSAHLGSVSATSHSSIHGLQELRARLASIGRFTLGNASSATDHQAEAVSSKRPPSPLKLETPTKGSTFQLASLYPSTPLSHPVPAASQSVMCGHQCPTLYSCAHVTFCCIQKPQPMYVAVKHNRRVSMYSNWRLATHNPNPEGLTPRMLLALYRSGSVSDPVYSQCLRTTRGGGNQTHSSYWTFHRSKAEHGLTIRSKSHEKSHSMDLHRSSSTESSLTSAKENLSNNNNRKQRLKMCRTAGGFKSDEQYEYVRGRGYGKYVCHMCHIRCKKPSMLKKHLRTHTDLRPYNCRHCHFSFKTKGNLTKHMKSKSHQKKCFELGIIPVPTSVDESQIDAAALKEQVRISREATIQDGTAALGSGDEGEDDEGDEEEEMDDEDIEGGDEDEEDEKMRSLSTSSSFEQDHSGLTSPRVLKRQLSVDEASPMFVFGHGQQQRASITSSASLQSSSEDMDSRIPLSHRASSPNYINTEIARSLQDLAQPKKIESKEIVDEAAQRDVQRKLQALISQLMAEKKPLSGLKVSTLSDGASKPNSAAAAEPLPTAKDVSDTLPEGNKNSLELPRSESVGKDLINDDEPQDETMLSSDIRPLPPEDNEMNELPEDNARKKHSTVAKARQSPVFFRPSGGLVTDEKDNNLAAKNQLPSSERGPQSSGVSIQSLARPSHLSLVQVASSRPSSDLPELSSPSKQNKPSEHASLNPPSPSLLAFLPPYASSRQSQKLSADQGPIIGQFVRKAASADAMGIAMPLGADKDNALTPRLVLEGQSHPFQFNIPFPGHSQGIEEEDENDETPAILGTHKFLHPIPIVTITGASSGTPSPSFDDSPLIMSPVEDTDPKADTPLDITTLASHTREVKDASLVDTSPSFSSATMAQSSTATAVARANITTHTMIREQLSATSLSSTPTLPSFNQQSAPALRSSTKASSLEHKGRSNSVTSSLPTSCLQSDSAIASLVHKSSLPFLPFTNPDVCNSLQDKNQLSSSENENANTTNPAGLPISRRTRRLSSGKSRFLRRQRSLDDGTAFPSVNMDVFDQSSTKGSSHSQSSIVNDQSGLPSARSPGERPHELVKSRSFHHHPLVTDEPVKASGRANEVSTKIEKITQSNVVERNAPLPSVDSHSKELFIQDGQKDKEKHKFRPVDTSMSELERSSSNEAAGHQDNLDCKFCSIEFSTKEKFQEHLKSRAHIRVLETLGALPAGTYERLQHSEQREATQRAHEQHKKEEKRDREQRDLKEYEKDVMGQLQPTSVLHTEGKPGSSSDATSKESETTKPIGGLDFNSLDRANTANLGIRHGEEQVVLKASLSREGQFVRRAHSQVDMPSFGGGSRVGKPPLLKRKISMPSSGLKSLENATVLSSPHLKDDLRRSLAKRARQGLLAGSFSSSHGSRDMGEWADADTEARLVIDEQGNTQGNFLNSPKSGQSAASPTNIVPQSSALVGSSFSPVSVSVPHQITHSITTTSQIFPLLQTSQANSSIVVSTIPSSHPHPLQQLPPASVQLEALAQGSSMRLPSRTPDSSMTNINILKEQKPVVATPLVSSTPSGILGKTIVLVSPPTSSSIIYGQLADPGKMQAEYLQQGQGNANTVSRSQPILNKPLIVVNPRTSTSLNESSEAKLSSFYKARFSQSQSQTSQSLPPLHRISSTPVSETKTVTLMSTVSEVGNRQFACGLCDLSFPSEELRKTHVQTHAEPRPHVCEFCDAGFTNSRSLRIHLLTHGQDRPYICGNCGDTFANMSDLQSHYSSHSSTSIASNQWNLTTQLSTGTSQSASPLQVQDLANEESSAESKENGQGGTMKLLSQSLLGQSLDTSSPVQQQQQQQHGDIQNELLAFVTETVAGKLNAETESGKTPGRAESNPKAKGYGVDHGSSRFLEDNLDNYGSDQDDSGVSAAWEELKQQTGADIFVQGFRVEENDSYDDSDGGPACNTKENGNGNQGVSSADPPRHLMIDDGVDGSIEQQMEMEIDEGNKLESSSG
ncbi:Zinc finger protein, partial [Plakobranchus ocellatus]